MMKNALFCSVPSPTVAYSKNFTLTTSASVRTTATVNTANQESVSSARDSLAIGKDAVERVVLFVGQ